MANTTKAATRTKTTAAAKKPPGTTTTRTRQGPTRAIITGDVTPDMRHQMIAEAAYLRAERRGFSPGDPLADWLAAEREVDRLLNDRTAPIAQ